MTALLFNLWACTATAWPPAPPPLPTVPAQVEDPEGTGAWLVPLDGSPAVMVYRWQLPPETKEGDVIVDGKVDAQRTAEHHRELARRLAEIERLEQAGSRHGR